MNKYKKLISNSIIFAIGNLTVKIAQFFLLPILTLYFTTEQYGLSTTLLDMVELLTPLVTLGIAEGLFRFTVDGTHKNEELMSTGVSVVLCGFIIFAVGDLIIYAMFPQNYILLLIPLFFVRGFKKLIAEFARGLGRTVLYAFNGILESIALIGSAALFLFVWDMGIEGYVLALTASALVSMLFYIFACKPFKYIRFSSITKAKLKSMVLYSLPSIPNMLSWWIVQLSSQYVIIWFVGMDMKGLFTAASKIPALINVVSNIFLQAWSLSSAEECADEKRNKFYSDIYRYYRVLIALAVCFVIAITPYISKFLLQAEFYEAWKYSPMLIVASGLGCISAFFGAFFGAFYKPHLGTITTLFGAILNIALSFSLVPFIGVYGAVIANTAGYVIIVVTRILYCKKLVKLEVGHLKTTLSFIVLGAQAVIYSLNLPLKLVWSACALVVIFLLYLKDVKGLIKIILSLFKGKKIKVDTENAEEKKEEKQESEESAQEKELDKSEA